MNAPKEQLELGLLRSQIHAIEELIRLSKESGTTEIPVDMLQILLDATAAQFRTAAAKELLRRFGIQLP